jgi:hypothetical protein
VRRILPPLGIIAAGVLLSVIVFVTLRNLETENARASFDGVAQERLDALETNVTLTLNNLVSIGALFDALPEGKRDQFGPVHNPLVGAEPGHPGFGMDPESTKRVEDELRRERAPGRFSIVPVQRADFARQHGSSR